MDKAQKQAYWEGVRADLLKHEPYIRQVLADWRKLHPDWVCNFWFSDYPPTFHIEFARLQQGNRAGETYYQDGDQLHGEPVWVCRLLSFDELGIPEPQVTEIVQVTGLKCKRLTTGPGHLSTYKLWSKPQ